YSTLEIAASTSGGVGSSCRVTPPPGPLTIIARAQRMPNLDPCSSYCQDAISIALPRKAPSRPRRLPLGWRRRSPDAAAVEPDGRDQPRPKGVETAQPPADSLLMRTRTVRPDEHLAPHSVPRVLFSSPLSVLAGFSPTIGPTMGRIRSSPRWTT